MPENDIVIDVKADLTKGDLIIKSLSLVTNQDQSINWLETVNFIKSRWKDWEYPYSQPFVKYNWYDMKTKITVINKSLIGTKGIDSLNIKVHNLRDFSALIEHFSGQKNKLLTTTNTF
ncbi:hypothetical protein EI74_0574 [Mycoplasma testudineum]|uniref:Uncharacterized protein n=2 Tax=Mycoplasma testudineum TaxID=244584 RepID=A0A4R6IDP5_9MOLU|nr:hypothetical protein [Mycoplasma testudineum]OYD26414.1 hypothetical protein CG473_04100 [Mycoplasma testudineum]TDO19771.1 hypothetical protein EI74_0574 [Mycoplasma testudineum]